MMYVETQRTTGNTDLTLNDYLKERFYKNSNAVVVADLSDMQFDRQYDEQGKAKTELLDLKGVNFSGAIISNTTFSNCNLENAVFCDTDLNNATFKENNTLKNIDLRGADLATCKFDDAYKDYSKLEQANRIAGIKFSTTSALGRQYADIKVDLYHQKEKDELTQKKQQEVNGVYSKLPYGWQLRAENDDIRQYKKLSAELDAMKTGKFPPKDYVMHPSFQNVYSSEANVFDPAYIRGSNHLQRATSKEYVRLSRDDITQYLERVKSNPNLQLNDFAKEKFKTAGGALASNTEYIADCSSGGNLDNTLTRLNLSGLDFTGAKINNAVFAGSDLRGCNFTGADISRSNFEGTDLGKDMTPKGGMTSEQTAIFDKTIARDTNFFNTNISEAVIKDSDFKRAFMPRSNAMEANIQNTNFDYANIKNGKWDNTKIADATFNFANMEGVSLAGADVRRVQAQHAILNKAVLDNCKIIQSDFSAALMQETSAVKANLQGTILQNIEAKGINLSEAKLNEFTKLDGANLEKAILDHINAERVSFVGANMDMVNAKFANLAGANLENAKARFANLDNAILKEAKASGVDMTGAKLNKAQAIGADFSKAVLNGVEAQKAEFTKTNFTEADLRNCNLKEAVLKEINAHKAKVNANTDLAKAKIEATTGEMQNYNSEGKQTSTISVEQQKSQSEEIENAKNPTWYKKAAGNVLKWCGKGAKKVEEIASKVQDKIQGFTAKYGKIVGAVVGIGTSIGIAGAIVATGGLGLLGAAAVYGGCALAGAGLGAVGAHYAQKYAGAGSLVGAGLGVAVTGSPLGIIGGAALGEVANKVLEKTTGIKMNAGTALGVTLAVATSGVAITPMLIGSFAGLTTDAVVQKVTGKPLTELGKDGYEGLIKLCEDGARKLAGSPEITAMVKEATKCEEQYQQKKTELENSINAVTPDKTQDYALRNNFAKQQELTVDGLEKTLKTHGIIKEERQQTKHSNKKQAVGKFSEQVLREESERGTSKNTNKGVS